MKKLNFTQEQITQILTEVANSDNGFNQVLQISLEAMMRAEREGGLFMAKQQKLVLISDIRKI